MASFLLNIQKSIYPDVFEEALPTKKLKVARRYYIVEKPIDWDLEQRCLLFGVQIYPIIFNGTIDDALASHNPKYLRGDPRSIPINKKRQRYNRKLEDKYLFYLHNRAYVTEKPINEEQISKLRQFKDGFYGNVFFMGALMYLHQDIFNKQVVNLVDMFLGKGGSLIAGLEYGAKKIVGFELDHSNFTAAKGNLENYLVSDGRAYESSGDSTSTEYRIFTRETVSTINVYWGNSIQDGPSVIGELGLKDFEVISDIPWGCHKCLAVSDERITRTSHMGKFHRRLKETLVQLSAERITMAHHSNVTLDLNVVKRIKTPGLYDVVVYRPNC